MHARPLKPLCLILVAAAWLLPPVFASVARAQDTDMPVIAFTPSGSEPVLIRGDVDAHEGDCGTIYGPKVVGWEGSYYLFYTGSCERGGRPSSVNYATSTDGVTWEKYESNPVLTPDGDGYDAMCVSGAVPFVDGDGWSLYYAANSQPCAGPGRFIGRATALGPDGDWQRDPAPVLSAGPAGAWDHGFLMPHAIVKTDDGYRMYYSGGEEFLVPLPRYVGMATSPDGVTWTKYDDPATVDPPFAESDPLMEILPDGTVAPLAIWALDVMLTDRGWEMFFSGTCPNAPEQDCPGFIGYGSSEDGLAWRAYIAPELRVLTPAAVGADWSSHCVCYPSAVVRDDEYWLYFTGCADGMNDCQIGLATGTIQRYE